MPKVAVYNMDGAEVGNIELNDAVFGVEVNEELLHRAVVRYQANQRVGTAAVKDRSAVRGGGRKPWRQKGTGRARAGTIRSPLWRGGGVVFGPQPRDFSLGMPKKMRRQALKCALSSKLLDGDIIVVDQLTFEEPKTKKMASALNSLKADAKTSLVVTGGREMNIEKSARNIAGVEPMEARNLNTYAVLRYKKLVLTKEAVAKLEEVLA